MYNNKIDKLDALILLAGDVLIEKNLNSDLLNGASSVSRPKSLDRKIARMIRHEKRHPYNEALIMLKQTAAAVLVICTLMFTLAMSVDAVREAFWNSVVEWFDKYISVVYEIQGNPPEVIEEYKEPQLVPVGCERVLKYKNSFFQMLNYVRQNDIVLTFRQSVLNEKSRHYDNTIDNTSEVYINDIIGYTTVNENGRCLVYWIDMNYLYEITFDENYLSIQTAISIAESLN